MPAPGEHKTVQAHILKYAEEIGWTYVPRAEAEARRGLTEGVPPSRDNPPLNNGGQECPSTVEEKP
jgi:hypothetical protein